MEVKYFFPNFELLFLGKTPPNSVDDLFKKIKSQNFVLILDLFPFFEKISFFLIEEWLAIVSGKKIDFTENF